MSLFTLPVTAADIAQTEEGIQFFQGSAANQAAVAAAINAPGSTQTVFTYAASLLNSNLAFSQVAMGLFPFMTGVTDTTAHIGVITTQFLPAQVTFAASKGFNPTVFAAEAYGSALSTNAAFNANFVTPFANNPAGFAAAVSAATGVSAAAILQFVNNWTAFFTANPSALQGRTVTQAAFGSAFGDAFGTALLTPGLSSNIATVFSTNAAFPFSPNTVIGIVANALIDNTTGQYQTGVALGALAPGAHIHLQGEGGTNIGQFQLTINPDNFVTNFNNPIFYGLPGQTVLGLSNTLNAGDNLVSNAGNGTLNYTAVFSTQGNPPLATDVTMTGFRDVFILNTAAGVAGFSGNITGLLNVTFLAGSTGDVQLGLASAGLNSALQSINIHASWGFTAWMTDSALAGTTDAVQINLNGVTTEVHLNVTTGSNGYEIVNIASAGGANALQLDTNAGSLATINVAGTQKLNLGFVHDFAGTIDASLHSGGLDVAIGSGKQTVITGTGNDRVEVTSANAPDLINLTAGGADRVEFENFLAGDTAPISNANYHLIQGFTIAAPDAVEIDLSSGNWNIATTQGVFVGVGNALLTLSYTTNTVADATVAGFNFIKVLTAVDTNWLNPEQGFAAAMGTGHMTTTAGATDVLLAYYDVTNSQMVLGFVDDPGDVINISDDFEIITLIAMTKADYDTFAGGNLVFV